MEKLSSDELLLLERMESRREIRNIMGRISHDYSIKQEAAVYDRYFSRRDDVCLGLNNGYYKGAKAVAGYYWGLGEEIALSSALIQKKFPDKLGSLSAEKVSGVGMMTYLPFDSHVIEIAGDGLTAKGIWNVRGSYCLLETGGPVAYWTFGWAAGDFIWENNEWKIWHLQLVYNINHQCGVGFCDKPKAFEPVPGFEAIGKFKLPEPNVSRKVMDCFYPDRPRTMSPPCPVPYDKFENTFSYGI